MVKLINTIKKWFINIVGILFFIVAIYVMLIPHNCKLKNKGFFESFMDSDIPPNTDSISAYMELLGKNKKTVVEFDKHLITNKNIIQDGKPNGKLLILSRCYQIPEQLPININNPTTINNNNIFGSYTESLFIKKVTDFDVDILQKIRDSVKTFYTNLNINKNCNTISDVPNKIAGSVYVIIVQYPLYQDNSTSTISDVKITSSILSQSVGTGDKRYIYSPSYIAPISNYLVDTDTQQETITNTPISYMIFIIYDSYSTGPQSESNNGLNGCIQEDKGKTFSKSSKTQWDKNLVSTSEQCFISAMGASGFSYIGGCASYQGTSPTKDSQSLNNDIPNNNVFCTSPIQGDNKPWTYLVLYTINHEYIQFSVAQE